MVTRKDIHKNQDFVSLISRDLEGQALNHTNCLHMAANNLMVSAQNVGITDLGKIQSYGAGAARTVAANDIGGAYSNSSEIANSVPASAIPRNFAEDMKTNPIAIT